MFFPSVVFYRNRTGGDRRVLPWRETANCALHGLFTQPNRSDQ